MKKVLMYSALMLAGAGLSQLPLTGILTAQEAEKPMKKVVRRLPAYYAQIGLTDEQRESIYSLQSEYGEKMEALQKQLDDLSSQRDTEIEGVLKPDQKARLKELTDAAAAKRRSGTKSSEPASDDK